MVRVCASFVVGLNIAHVDLVREPERSREGRRRILDERWSWMLQRGGAVYGTRWVIRESDPSRVADGCNIDQVLA